MTETRSFSPARLFTLLAAFWLAAGAYYKLFHGNPGDLPAPYFDWFGWLGSKDTLYLLAIAAEFVVIVLALLRPKLGWIALVGTYVLFEAILAALIASGAESCGCFGGSIEVPPLVMASIDGVLVVGLLATRPWKASGMHPIGPTAIVGLLIVAGAIAPVLKLRDSGDGPTITEIETAKDEGREVALPRFVTLTPPEWIGQSIYDTPLARWLPNIADLPTDGNWVFWRWTCDHCAEHLRLLAAEPGLEPLVLIRVNEKTDEPDNGAVDLMPEGGHVYHAALTADIDWVLSTPADMQLIGGEVIEARENIQH